MRMNTLQTLAVAALVFAAQFASGATLQAINFAELPGERAELRMSFDSTPTEPQGYTIEQPARIVLDLADVVNGLSKKKFPMSIGDVTGAVVVEGGGRTRIIVNMNNLAPYTTRIQGSDLILEIGTEMGTQTASASPSSSAGFVGQTSESMPAASSEPAISEVDFRRGEVGEGKVIISLTDPRINIDVREVSGGLEAKFLNTELDASLQRKLDVVDFATPVKTLGVQKQGSNVVISVAAQGEYDYLAYQADNEYVISVKPLTREEIEEKEREFQFVGERLSLNFQNIQVRSVLQLIADFTELNLVASDTVSGSITLRLENVPWDQALDIVLKTKGLDKRQIGNVLMVAPAAEIAERERQEIETKKQLQELAPLRTEYIRIRYANARALFNLFIDEGAAGAGGLGGGGGADGRNSTGSILSDRGQAIVDERTNSIILTDTEEKIAAFKRLIDQIDIPIRQVMIEARLVIANNNFRKELGSRIAGYNRNDSGGGASAGGRTNEASGRLNAFTADTLNDNGTRTIELNDATMVDLAVFNPAGSFTWNVISRNFLLGLELSALENAGFLEIVSQPKVITGDKQEATIQSGTEIPYQEESASGGTTTAFKDAVLKLEVTPQITPDNRVIMDLVVTQDSISSIDLASGIPTLDITELETQVLVADGETIVLGGIYQTEVSNSQQKIPLLGDIPLLGRLFRNDVKRENKKELLIFITPKIMASEIVQ